MLPTNCNGGGWPYERKSPSATPYMGTPAPSLAPAGTRKGREHPGVRAGVKLMNFAAPLQAPPVTIPAQMSAAVVTAPHRLELREVPVPVPGAHEVLVRLAGCGVCASNLPPWEGRPWFTYPLAPGALGHEGWGRVAAVGREVTEFAPGERVAMLSGHAYAQYDVAAAGSLVRLPAALDGEAFPAEPLGCACNILRRAEIGKDDVVAVVGVGFLGALLIQLASAAGAQVLALTRKPSALRIAAQMGAAHCLSTDDHRPAIDAVRQLTDGQFCDVVIEAAGEQEPLDLATEITRERGRLVIAGYHQDGPRQVNMQLWNWRGLDVINAHERDPAVYLSGMRRAIGAVTSGLLTPAALYTHRFPLDQLDEALHLAAERPEGFMKALIIL
jgi:NADPH2:quinone reductase